MTARFDAPFVRWATLRTPARLDLAGSAIAGCTIDDIEGARQAIELTGDNSEGYRPLTESISARYGVPESGVTTAQGASGANFLVCAALLEHGDDVLVERPGYDALLGMPQFLGARTVRFDRSVQLTDSPSIPTAYGRRITPRTRLDRSHQPAKSDRRRRRPRRAREVGRIAEARGAHVLVDEVYLDAARSRSEDATFDHRNRGCARRRVHQHEQPDQILRALGIAMWVDPLLARSRRARAPCAADDGRGRVDRDRAPCRPGVQPDRPAVLTRTSHPAGEPASRSRVPSSRPELEWVQPEGGTVVFPRIRGVDDSDAIHRTAAGRARDGGRAWTVLRRARAFPSWVRRPDRDARARARGNRCRTRRARRGNAPRTGYSSPRTLTAASSDHTLRGVMLR